MRREDKIMLFTFIIVCSLITLGVVAIRQSVVKPVTQEQKQEVFFFGKVRYYSQYTCRKCGTEWEVDE